MNKDDVQQNQDVEAPDAHAEGTETDWKAQARKWEKRAKENSAAADELVKLKESQMIELERAQARARLSILMKRKQCAWHTVIVTVRSCRASRWEQKCPRGLRVLWAL